MRDVQMDSIRAIDRAIDVLNVFTNHSHALSIDDICKAARLPKATVYRILYTLERRNLIRFDADVLQYRLGFKLMEYGELVSSSIDIRNDSEKILNDLYEQTHQTVLLGIREGNTLVYIYRRENSQGLKVSLFEGLHRPLVYGAMGYVTMAFMEASQLKPILNDPIPKFTPNTVVDKNIVLSRLTQIRKELVWVEYGEAIYGVTAVAAPVFDGNRIFMAVVGIHGPSINLTGDELAKAKQGVLHAARMISGKIGGQ